MIYAFCTWVKVYKKNLKCFTKFTRKTCLNISRSSCDLPKGVWALYAYLIYERLKVIIFYIELKSKMKIFFTTFVRLISKYLNAFLVFLALLSINWTLHFCRCVDYKLSKVCKSFPFVCLTIRWDKQHKFVRSSLRSKIKAKH